MAGTEQNADRPAEEARLDFLLGDWVNTGQTFPSPFGPAGPVTGNSTYAWDLGGRWLLYTSQLNLPGLGEYEVRGGVNFDRAAGAYRAFAVNSLGVLICYSGRWQDDLTLAFTSTYPPAPRPARVVYTRLADGTVGFRSERATEGGDYETYFETSLARA